jgi:hypothetical protein
VVILTGHLGSMIEPEFVSLPGVEIIEKPIRIHQLKSIVDKHIGRPNGREAPMTSRGPA